LREFRFDYVVPLASVASTGATKRIGHNRWHPDLEPIAEVTSGEVIAMDLWDGLDCQINRESDRETVAGIDGHLGHPMTGPFAVAGAREGDYIEVEILEIQPDTFGYTCVLPGFGLLPERFTEPFLVRWDIVDGIARSADLPGIAIRGRPFLGVIGVAPSHETLARFSAREAELAETGATVFLPDPAGAFPPREDVETAGLRTIPPRELGGNMDIKELGAGSRLLLRCDVDGGLVSLGDPHFAQGDGESCGVAIEMGARATVRLSVRPHETVPWKATHPTYRFVGEEGPQRRREFIATTGIPVYDDGRNGNLDVHQAAKVAFNEMVDYLVATHGLSDEQAYVLASVAADLRISSIVNLPNPMVSAVLPLDVFEAAQPEEEMKPND
jgi:formamidase